MSPQFPRGRSYAGNEKACDMEEGLGDLQREEDKDLGPNSGLVVDGVYTECLKGGQDDENGRPAVVERERKVDEELVRVRLRRVVFLHDVVDVLRRTGETRADRE